MSLPFPELLQEPQNRSLSLPPLLWEPQYTFQLIFTDCELAAAYMVTSPFLLGYDLILYEAGADLLRHGLSGYMQSNSQISSSEIPFHELEQWYNSFSTFSDDDYDNPLEDVMINFTWDYCRKDVCPELGWQGNTDIAGSGMLYTYILQALLTTLYTSVLVAIRYDWVPATLRKFTSINRFTRAVQHSTGTFLNTSFVFCIAMLLATLISCALGFTHGYSRSINISIDLSLLMTLYSIIPPALLQMVASKTLRRNQARRIIWILVAVVVLVTCTLRAVLLFRGGFEVANSLNTEEYAQMSWEIQCLEAQVIYVLPVGTLAVVLGFGFSAAGIAYIIWIVAITLRPKGSTPSSHRSVRRVLWWIAGIWTFSTMWLSLGWLIKVRRELESIGGETNKDNEWSFGQILAVGTWVPVLVEFGYLWWQEPVEALSGRLMDPFQVVEMSETGGGKQLSRRVTV